MSMFERVARPESCRRETPDTDIQNAYTNGRKVRVAVFQLQRPMLPIPALNNHHITLEHAIFQSHRQAAIQVREQFRAGGAL